MSRKNKQKIRKLSKNKTSGVVFEDVEDANLLLAAYLDEVKPTLSEAESDDFEDRFVPLARKRKIEKTPIINIDLHHLTADEACAKVDNIITANKAKNQRVEFNIITGKGRHSGPTGAILPRHVHNHVKTRYKFQIVSIESSPADDLINGLPIRGYFKVILEY